MVEKFDLFSFLVGLPLAIIISIIIFAINRKIGKKKRWFDERYRRINEKARSVSWISTTIAILLAWMIIIVMEGPGLSFFIMTGIWLIHMISYLVGAIIANQDS